LLSVFKLPNLEVAEDIVQNTFLAALKSWSVKGMPEEPVAWLFKVCKNKAINELKRRQKNGSLSFLPNQEHPSYFQLEQAFLPDEIRDNQLRLLFATCHPNFSPKSQLILTLKILAGFRVEEIAKGLGMKTEAVKKNLARTKSQIRKSNMQLHVPFRMQSRERLNTIHQFLYLLFNEGYRASSGEREVKAELCLEAMRLTRSLLEEKKIINSDTSALFSLMLFHAARFDSRFDAAGEIIDLKQQDRSRWDPELIQEGIRYFNQSNRGKAWSKFHFEAAIASLHCLAPSFAETNWPAVVKLYDGMLQVNNSCFVYFNRTIALFYAGKPRLALSELLGLKGLEENPLYYTALAEMYAQLKKKEEALTNFLKALGKSSLSGEQKYLKKKIKELQEHS
jgi:RNA polymerase sigma factor (sigma-70 family)